MAAAPITPLCARVMCLAGAPDLDIGPGAGGDPPLRRGKWQLLLSQPGAVRVAPQLVLAAQAMAGKRGVDPMRYTRA
jgi:hypothetical protein